MESKVGKIKNQTIITTFTYLGSLLVAVCLLIPIHEFGHAIAYAIKGYENITISINPFMGITSTSETIQMEDAFLIAAGGTIFDILIAILIAGIFWKFSSPYLLPLKMYPVMAFLIEGVVILAGFFFSDSYTDFAILIDLGFPVFVVGIISAVLILGGLFGMYQIWGLLGIQREDSFLKVLLVNIVYPLYFGVAYVVMGVLIGSFVGDIQILMLISLVIHIGLLLLLTSLHKVILPKFVKILPKNIKSPDVKVTLYCILMGVAFVALSLIFFN